MSKSSSIYDINVINVMFKRDNRIMSITDGQTFVEFKRDIVDLLQVKNFTIQWMPINGPSVFIIGSEAEFEYLKGALRKCSTRDALLRVYVVPQQ